MLKLVIYESEFGFNLKMKLIHLIYASDRKTILNLQQVSNVSTTTNCIKIENKGESNFSIAILTNIYTLL